jgi:hypothetical protein
MEEMRLISKEYRSDAFEFLNGIVKKVKPKYIFAWIVGDESTE